MNLSASNSGNASSSSSSLADSFLLMLPTTTAPPAPYMPPTSDEYSTIQLIQAMFADDCVFHPTTENYVMIVAFCIIFCLSVIGNSVVVVVILQQRSMRSVTNLYLLNLALSDLLLSVVCMPPTLVSSLVYCWVFGDLLCKLLAYLQPVVVTASAYTLAAIAAERYYAICKPLHSRVWHTRSHAMAVIAFVWLISIIINFFMLFMYELRTYNKNGLNCSPKYNPPVHFIYQVYMTVMLLIIPLVIMSVLYSKVIHSLKTGIRMDIAAIEVDNNNDEKKSDENKSNGAVAVEKGNGVNSHGNGMSHKRNRWMSFKGDSTSGDDFSARKGAALMEQRVRSTHSERTALVKQRLIRMLIVIVIIFFCCWTPSYIWWLLLNAQDSFGTFNVWNSELNTFITVLTYLSSCTNPITYCFLNSKFRNALFLSFGCKSIHSKIGDGSKRTRTHLQRIYAPINNTTAPISKEESSNVTGLCHRPSKTGARSLTLSFLNRLKNAIIFGNSTSDRRRYTESPQVLEEPLARKLKVHASASSSYPLSSKESNI